METAIAGFHALHLVGDVGAFGDLAKYSLAPALRRG
jgi:hypothetical protein